jgi:hypothetical protein
MVEDVCVDSSSLATAPAQVFRVNVPSFYRGPVCIETVPAGTRDPFDTVLTFRASCTSASSLCDDDGGDGLLSRIEVNVEPGQVFGVAVSRYGGGDFAGEDVEISIQYGRCRRELVILPVDFVALSVGQAQLAQSAAYLSAVRSINGGTPANFGRRVGLLTFDGCTASADAQRNLRTALGATGEWFETLGYSTMSTLDPPVLIGSHEVLQRTTDFDVLFVPSQRCGEVLSPDVIRGVLLRGRRVVMAPWQGTSTWLNSHFGLELRDVRWESDGYRMSRWTTEGQFLRAHEATMAITSTLTFFEARARGGGTALPILQYDGGRSAGVILYLDP